ncbi:two-component regulator propeller domain-containing protein [Mangrovibacterium sp.]|uniref:hybrid sensor histidine kinase/response regulator transcription factor n=1 Tax=Mangrovibacterium sp. TaxID=1961364 RepID=UPI003566F579
MKKLYLSIVILLHSIYSSAVGNIVPGNQKIEKFVSEQGFFQNTVHAITSDNNGYLWIATPNGLARYDGYSFEHFYHDFHNAESIPGNKVRHLLNDSAGRLWIATNQGLCIYHTGNEQYVPFTHRILDGTFMKEDAQGRVWIGKDSKLHIFNSKLEITEIEKNCVVLDFQKELEGEKIVDIEFYNDSVFLLASPSGIYQVTLNERQPDSFTVRKLSFDYIGNGISKLIKTDQTIWVGTDNGIYQTLLENNRLTSIRLFFNSSKPNQEDQINVQTIFFDKEKNLWIGTKRNGILKYNNETEGFVAYKFDPKNVFGLTSNRINCFYEDVFGVLWIGTAQGGLNKLDKNQKPFQNYTHNPYDNESLSSNLINDIIEDKKGHIWISFFDNLICRSNNEIDITEGHRIQFTRQDNQLGKLRNSVVVRLFQDLKGYWWIGCLDGLYFYDETNDKLRKVQLKSTDGIFTTQGNRVIEQINSNQILIGGSHVYLLDEPWNWILDDKPVPVGDSLFDIGENNSVIAFKKDDFGNLWFGTQNGIYRVLEQDKKFVVMNHLHSDSEDDKLRLSHNFIFCVHYSSGKTIWIGAFGGGLMKLDLNESGDPKEIRTYHKNDGLPDEVVYGILEDDDGKLWMSTDMGICRLDPVSGKFDVYDVSDGIMNNNFRQSSFFKTKTGLMLMGGLNGLTVFNPKQITKNEILPKVLISRLKINDQQIVAGEEFNKEVILTNSITDTRKLVLDYQNRNISLDIVVQHYSTPKKNRLSYMLEGVNANWIEFGGGKTTATYTNLNAGTYRFLYKGTNGDGIWTANTGELIIRVLAPWYFRWWSLTIWAAFVLLVIYGVFMYLVRLEKLKQNLKFEQLDKERIHEMDQAKLRFFTNITHDFKTPLSLIIGPLEKIADRYQRKEDQKYVSIIQSNISRLQKLIEQLISYRKAETGHLDLKYTNTSLGNFIYPLLEAFEENAKRTNVNFFYKVNSPNRLVTIDIDSTERILMNLFSNAVKFTGQDGEVSIEAGFREVENTEVLYIEVSDTGIGIPQAQLEKIFDRFYRAVDDRGSWRGTGIGLALCKSLVELMKGKIAVESIPGEKTVFKIDLPFDIVAKADADAGEDMIKHRKIVTDWMPSELSEFQESDGDSSLPSILIIDDEQDVRSFLHEAFSSNYKVTLAVDGEEGLKKLAECDPLLVISDVMMPKLSGYELCEKIKSDPKTCHIPVILLTALDDDAKMIEGLELGADDYIKKPFSIKHLEIRVKKLIESKKRILEYFANSRVIPAEDLGMPERDRHFLQCIIALIETNMSDSTFGVEELAKSAGMSSTHLYRRLKQLTGQVPNVYLRNFRLQKAAELLKSNKDINAVEVMYEIGIESPSYLSTAFKKLHGVSPSEFQKRS